MLCVNPTGNILKWYKAFFKLRLIILARVLSVKKGLRLRRILTTWAQMPLQSHFLPLSSALCSVLGVSDFPVVSGCYIFNYDLTLGGVHGFYVWGMSALDLLGLAEVVEGGRVVSLLTVKGRGSAPSAERGFGTAWQSWPMFVQCQWT